MMLNLIIIDEIMPSRYLPRAAPDHDISRRWRWHLFECRATPALPSICFSYHFSAPELPLGLPSLRCASLTCYGESYTAKPFQARAIRTMRVICVRGSYRREQSIYIRQCRHDEPCHSLRLTLNIFIFYHAFYLKAPLLIRPRHYYV